MICRLTLALAISLTISCAHPETATRLIEESSPSSTPPAETQISEESPPYRGTTIDQIFPPTSVESSIDDDGREEKQTVDVGGYSIRLARYVPKTLLKGDRTIFNFKPRSSKGYWGSVVGISHLLGPESNQLWIAVSGPGVVCCTNYSIVDVSKQTPKGIFHSEDFGSFRDPMEIFDADNDGVYEVVQFDSCMRYFMGDCGSCSPEPRVHFKYDPRRKQYVPVAGVAQEFYRENLDRNEKWIDEKFREWKQSKDPGLGTDIARTLLYQVSALLHMGDEKKAWSMFKRYGHDNSGKIRTELKKSLADCKFYQALRSH